MNEHAVCITMRNIGPICASDAHAALCVPPRPRKCKLGFVSGCNLNVPGLGDVFE